MAGKYKRYLCSMHLCATIISIVHPVLQFDSKDKTLLRCDEVFLTSTVLRQMKLMFMLNFSSGIRRNTVIFYLKFSTGWALRLVRNDHKAILLILCSAGTQDAKQLAN